MIIKDQFSVTLGKRVINVFIYEIERSEENEKEVVFRYYTTNGGGKTQTITFETDKTDEEIASFFKEKHEKYSEVISKKWFFLKSVPLVKFGKEIELYLDAE